MSVSIGSRCHVGCLLLLLLLLLNHAKASNLELTCDIDLSDIPPGFYLQMWVLKVELGVELHKNISGVEAQLNEHYFKHHVIVIC